MSKILEKIDKPSDLNTLSLDELKELADETRELIIDTVSHTGGHLAANLGVVELTIALLRCFDQPQDRLVWDTGHQCYTHKILTGRRHKIHTLRQFNGLAGFLKRDESPYDAFGAGHAGTALSAALGMAAARDRNDGNEHVVAIVGDAAAGCGISLEALNSISETTRKFIVVLNDNEMSIAENVGAISRYLGGLLSNPRYNRWKKSVESIATQMKMGWLRSTYYRMEEAIKSLFLSSVLFEEFGLRYVGPIDGHDFEKLLDALEVAKNSDRPILLHVSTQKGKGYHFAEKEPETWHGTSCFNVASGTTDKKETRISYSAVFGKTITQLAQNDSKICAITAGMCKGTGLAQFAKEYPKQFFDVGISEEHGAVFAAGLAASGMKPFFAVYSTFSQRVVDPIIHDICLQKLPVVLCLDRAGIVGDDGPTHHGIFDIVLLRSVPNLIMMQPRNEAELANMLYTAYQLDQPVVIRYPRGSGTGEPLPEQLTAIPVGEAEVLTPGREVQIWALGDMIPLAEKAAALLQEEDICCGIVNPRFIRPLCTELLNQHAKSAQLIVSMENGMLHGGFGSALRETLAEQTNAPRVLSFGWPDIFVPHGACHELMQQHGLNPEAMAQRISSELKSMQ